jgi:hypothetical protein
MRWLNRAMILQGWKNKLVKKGSWGDSKPIPVGLIRIVVDRTLFDNIDGET